MNNFDLPKLDFDKNQAYFKHTRSIKIGFRLKVFIKFVRQFLVVLFRTLYFGGLKSVLIKKNGTSNPVIEEGIYVSRLEDSIVSELKKELSQTKQDLLASRAQISKRVFSDNQTAIRGDLLNSLIDILNNSEEVKRMLEMAKDWFSSDRASISRLTLQINDVSDNTIMSEAISDEDIGTDYMHIDAAMGQLKLIVYMSDVDEGNGPTSYVPSTNKPSGLTFRRLVGASIDNLGFSGETEIERRSFMALPRFLRHKANFGNNLTPNSALSKFLLDNERRIIGPTGTIFLFDPSGVHRGALLKESTRTILQIQIRTN